MAQSVQVELTSTLAPGVTPEIETMVKEAINGLLTNLNIPNPHLSIENAAKNGESYAGMVFRVKVESK